MLNFEQRHHKQLICMKYCSYVNSDRTGHELMKLHHVEGPI
jgi:hypothetical protein